jgi:aryl-alcohol dehydrogenase-like predicted oxidoreductase
MRKIGKFEVTAISLGCMSMSHAYGEPPPAEHSGRVLNEALDLGYTMLDTAALYGFGANETLIGNAIGHRRNEYILASKCSLHGVDGKRELTNNPAKLKQSCEDSLRRLQTDVIDLFYLHRYDKVTPLEDSIGALSDLVHEGKVREIGLSEVSAETLRKAHAIHPIAAVQSEYSLWTREPEIAIPSKKHAEILSGQLCTEPRIARRTGTVVRETQLHDGPARSCLAPQCGRPHNCATRHDQFGTPGRELRCDRR